MVKKSRLEEERDEFKRELQQLKDQIKIVKNSRIMTHVSTLRGEYRKHVSTAIITAFGLVVALVWKDFITALMPSITIPGLLERYPLFASLYSALIITALAVIGIIIVSRWMKTEAKK